MLLPACKSKSAVVIVAPLKPEAVEGVNALICKTEFGYWYKTLCNTEELEPIVLFMSILSSANLASV